MEQKPNVFFTKIKLAAVTGVDLLAPTAVAAVDACVAVVMDSGTLYAVVAAIACDIAAAACGTIP
jgi:hypothetical protein